MLVALSVVFARLLAPVNTNVLRFSLGNVPVVLCGVFFGGVPGAVCGLAADAIGCFLNGYPPYPLLMMSPAIVGFLPGTVLRLASRRKKVNVGNLALLTAVMVVTNFLSALVASTLALSQMLGTPYSVLFMERVPVTVVRTAAEITVLYLLLKNGTLMRLFGSNK